jgi:putative LysE/RhtB family amino acid efflux pump
VPLRPAPSGPALVISLGAAGVALGLVFAAQIGPVTLLIVRSVLRGGRAYAVALAMATAVALVDLLYATVGLAGVGHFLTHGSIEIAVGSASAAILVVVGARTVWTGVRARTGLELDEEVVAPRSAFVTAVAATALNPLTIGLWTETRSLVARPGSDPGRVCADLYRPNWSTLVTRRTRPLHPRLCLTPD